MNQAFLQWFKDSKAVDVNQRPQTFYHGSIEEFTIFDTNRIRADETDAVYNGFWFTSEQDEASPAWRDPKFVNAYYLSVQNPAPHEVVYELYKKIKNDPDTDVKYSAEKGFRSWADVVRYELQCLGYDGVIHQDVPEINFEEYEEKGETVYTTNRGFTYKLKKDTEWGGVDLYKVRQGFDDYLTGYEDIPDFLNQHKERVFVVFNPNQIKSIENTGTWSVEDADVRY